MKPGRELDALIAEKVMGWTGIEERPQSKNCSVWCGRRAPGDQTLDIIPQFSIKIEAAWEVVEKLKLTVWPTGQGRWFIHQDEFDESYGGEYWFGGDNFLDRVKDGTDNWAIAETAPHAICLAALKSIGHTFS